MSTKTKIVRAILFWTWDLTELMLLGIVLAAICSGCSAYAHG